MTFLRELLAVILGVFISFFVMFFVFLALGSLVSSSFMEEERVMVDRNSVLVLKFDQNIRDYAPKSGDPLEGLLGIEEENIGLNEILNAIDNAKYDDKIVGISVESLNLRAGLAQLQEIRDKLYEFKESGKFITAFSDVYDQKNYYLSSVADSIYLNPEGFLEFKGLAGEVLYFKDFQDKYGIRMEVIRHGKYKSAVEPFLENQMSPENREQLSALMQSIWSEILEDVGDMRDLDQARLNNIADELLGRTPEMARDNQLISGILYRDQYLDLMTEMSGLDDRKDLSRISMKDYINSGEGRIRSSSKDKIAVIFAQGEIIYGQGDENFVGPELIIEALKKAREDDGVKAIVFRVNSPGGSALASDVIWRELELTKEIKPLVVSMGDMATSGGYYISCNADWIVADPMTITGSIGVFGVIPNISELSGRMGINAEQVGTNRQSVGYSVFEPMSEDFYKVTKEGVERVYQSFVSKVAQGRSMSFAQVDSIAQGRVWTGKEAIEIGLVDELGGLEDAISTAAELAEIESFRIRNYPQYKKEFKDLFKGPFGKVKEEVLRAELGNENFELFRRMEAIRSMSGMQARLPFLLEID
jgi:protease-4